MTQKPIPVSDKVWEWSTSELPNGNYQLYALLGTNISLSSVPLTIDHTLAKSPQILPLDPLYLDPELIFWLDQNRDEETSRAGLIRILIRKAILVTIKLIMKNYRLLMMIV